MDPINLIILLVVGGLVAAFLFWGAFRQFARIRGNKLVKSGTTAIEKQEDEYEQLMAKLPGQKAAVARAMGSAAGERQRLTDLQAAADALEAEFNEADELGASEAAKDELGEKYEAALAAVEAQKGVVDTANKAAERARGSLNATTKALGKFAARIEADKRKVALTEALTVSAEAEEQANAIQSQLSKAGAASAEIDAALREAEARVELNKGTDTEQELAALREKAAAKKGRAALEAKRAAAKGGAAPAGETPSAQ